MKISKFVVTGGSTLLLFLVVMIAPWYLGQLGAGLLLIAFLPGYALYNALWLHPGERSLPRLEQWLIAVAISFGLTIVLLLLMVYARLSLNRFSVAGGLAGLTLIFTLIAWRRQAKIKNSKPATWPTPYTPTNPQSQIVWLVVILLLAAFFRIANVHYSDYQGDEADVLLRAVSLAYGKVETILTHSKGPGEILLLNAVGALTGRFDEQPARLPFALAGTASIGLIALLGQQLFNRSVGIVAGLLAAIDGVFVSYARTAQYQSVVLLLTLAAIWCFYRFRQTGSRSRRLHGLGAFLLAASFLVHIEVILLLPVAGYLTVAHLGRFDLGNLTSYSSRLKFYLSRLAHLWFSAIIFVVITAAFYIPFLLHPNVRKTGAYLESRIGGGSRPPFNNLDHFFYFEALKYNSAYYVILFNLMLVAVVIGALAVVLNRSYWWGAGGVAILTLPGAGLVLVGQAKVSALVVGLGLAVFFSLVILSRQTDLPDKTLWLWIAPPFWIYVFLVNRPGKHHYLFLAALMIFTGLIVTQWWLWAAAHWPGLRRPAGQWLTVGLSVLLLLIFGGHTVMVILRSDLEYILTYPAHKSSFYPTDAAYPYRTRIGFGYPFRLGWQVIGHLRRTGQLEGSWAGNDSGNAPNWYMLGTEPAPCYPRYVLRGEITYKGDDNVDVPFDPNNFGYRPRYRIWGNGRLRMTVLEFNPTANEVEVIDLYETPRFDPPVAAAHFAPTLSAQSTSTPVPEILLEPPLVLGEGSELKNNVPPEYLERARHLAGRVALVGYDLDDRYAQPGGVVPITLYWRAQNLLSLRYKVFVHLISPAGQMLTQADDFPVCGTSHANTWGPGTLVLDRHLLKLPPDTSPGDYTLLVGMYEPDLNLRLNYFDVANNEQGNSLMPGTVTISSETANVRIR